MRDALKTFRRFARLTNGEKGYFAITLIGFFLDRSAAFQIHGVSFTADLFCPETGAKALRIHLVATDVKRKQIECFGIQALGGRLHIASNRNSFD